MVSPRLISEALGFNRFLFPKAACVFEIVTSDSRKRYLMTKLLVGKLFGEKDAIKL